MFGLTTLTHIIHVYELCRNTTIYPIFNMQDVGCAPPFWTVLVTWYLHHQFIRINLIREEDSQV